MLLRAELRLQWEEARTIFWWSRALEKQGSSSLILRLQTHTDLWLHSLKPILIPSLWLLRSQPALALSCMLGVWVGTEACSFAPVPGDGHKAVLVHSSSFLLTEEHGPCRTGHGTLFQALLPSAAFERWMRTGQGSRSRCASWELQGCYCEVSRQLFQMPCCDQMQGRGGT